MGRRLYILAIVCAALLVCIASNICLAAEPSWIFGIHDYSGYAKIEAANKRGWIVLTVEVGHNPTDLSGDDYRYLSDRGHGVIVRINNGYGSDGTLPYQTNYPDFATRCANYVAATQGVDVFIIGNETNLPREWPGNDNGDPNTGEAITVAKYIDCYTRCYNAIKAKRSTAQVCPTPSGTWAPPYDGSIGGIPNRGVEGFLTYWLNIINGIGASKIDGLILHVYTHGCDPALITDQSKMGAPYTTIYYNFQVYKNYMSAIPSIMRTKPVYITESDENIECADTSPSPKHTWKNLNNGWVKAAYSEINTWNSVPANQKIRCFALFRWDDVAEGDWDFGISNRSGVLTDWSQAMQNDYRWNIGQTGTISGSVKDSSGRAISGASITISPGGSTASTSSSGSYTVSSVIQGTYDVTVAAAGYGRLTQKSVVVNANATTTVNFTLYPVVTIDSAKKLADGIQTAVKGIVTARFPVSGSQTRFYVEDAKRTVGIAVDSTASVSLGDELEMQGTMGSLNGEKTITVTEVSTLRTGVTVPAAVCMSLRSLGGGAFGNQSAVLNDSISNTYSTGANNVGMLVRVCGKVTAVDSNKTYFYLSDGSTIRDGSGNAGVRVDISGLMAPIAGANVTVTGISSTTLLSNKLVRLLRPRTILDLSYAITQNMLNNPSFETGSISSWTQYGLLDGIISGVWSLGGITAHDGIKFLGSSAYGGTKSGGLYQRIAVPAGTKYQAKAWSCIYRGDNPVDSVQEWIGIDPTGGTNPTSSTVKKSGTDNQPTAYYGEWHLLTTPIVTSTSGYVTVFLDIKGFNNAGWHIGCFDDAQLHVIL